MPTKRLPPSANINHLKHQAKDLLSDFRASKMSAFQRIREFHPKLKRLGDEALVTHTFALSDAFLSIAREYGYASWPRLKEAVAKAQGETLSLIHNERIDDDAFRQALDFLDEGDGALLQAHLIAHPDLVHRQVFFEGDNYFREPRLLEFVAENPTRQESLPDNIVALTRIILDAGGKEHPGSVNYTLGLVASGRVARECGVQLPLIDLLCDYGATAGTALQTAVAHGEFDAAHKLIARGASVDLPAAAALNREAEVAQLLPDASEEELQLALAMAASHGHVGVVSNLPAAGADPNRYNPPGGHAHCTPLHAAAIGGHIETVKALVEGGARADIPDIHHNSTAIGWAEHGGHADIIAFFKAKTEL